MKRIFLGLCLTLALAAPALADVISDRVVANLNAQGYTVREMSRTWLGRIWVLAESDTVRREVVFNPGTGEILRDYAVLIAPQPGTQIAKQDGGATKLARGHDNTAVTQLSATATATASVLGADPPDARGGNSGDFGAVSAPQQGDPGLPAEVVVEPVNPLQ